MSVDFLKLICWTIFSLGFMQGLHAQTGPYGEKVEFESIGLPGQAKKVWGYLTLPQQPQPPLAAMVLVHGSGGLGEREVHYIRNYSAWGLAVLTVAPFESRGVVSTDKDQSLVSQREVNSDAAGALRLLQTHALIDPSRVGVQGGSKGGQAALDLAFTGSFRWRKMQTHERFALHIPIYAGCGTQFRQPRTTGKPILMLHGLKDDYTSPVGCKAYAERLRESGADIRFVGYEGAHHGFDFSEKAQPRWIGGVQNFSKCLAFMEPDGSVNDVVENKKHDTFAEFEKISLQRSCVTRGAHVGVNVEAKQKSLADIRAFLTTHGFLN